MKKASIALVLILAVMLVTGIACSSNGNSGGQSYTEGYAAGYAAGLADCSSVDGNGGGTQCSVCGKYIHSNKVGFIRLDSDGTCLLQQTMVGSLSYGTWEQEGDQILAKWASGDASIYTLQGDTLTYNIYHIFTKE